MSYKCLSYSYRLGKTHLVCDTKEVIFVKLVCHVLPDQLM